ncbi:MAG: hypothetical protein U0270_41825 [Labilithrix sp.]
MTSSAGDVFVAPLPRLGLEGVVARGVVARGIVVFVAVVISLPEMTAGGPGRAEGDRMDGVGLGRVCACISSLGAGRVRARSSASRAVHVQ